MENGGCGVPGLWVAPPAYSDLAMLQVLPQDLQRLHHLAAGLGSVLATAPCFRDERGLSPGPSSRQWGHILSASKSEAGGLCSHNDQQRPEGHVQS